MSEKKEQAMNEIEASFDEMATMVLHQLTLLEKLMGTADEKTRSKLMSYIGLRDMISNIERIADHATNIAEASIYSLQGTDIRHTGIGKEE